LKGELKIHTYTFKPTSYTEDETVAIMGVRRGTWVLGVFVRVGVAFTAGAPTISIGDGTGAEIFAAAADVACTVAGLKAGYGTAFSGANGKLYTTTDTVDLVYTHADTTVAGQCTAIIVYTEVE
jgi:hypothetical protein